MAWGALGAAALGGILGSRDKGGKPSKTTTVRDIPDWWEKPAMRTVDRGQRAGRRMNFVRPTESQQAALRQLEGFASGFDPSSGVVATASDQAQRTLGGDFLSPETNPALGATIDAATGQVIEDYERNILPQLGSQAQAQGAWGGARHGLAEAASADEVTETIGDISTRMLMDAYNSERQRQMTAMQMAPTLGNAVVQQELLPAQILGNVGNTRRGFLQEEEGFDFGREQEIASLLAALGPHGGSTTQVSTAARPSSAVRGLQGALGGLQLYNTFAGGGGGGNTIASGGLYNPWNYRSVTPINPAMGG